MGCKLSEVCDYVKTKIQVSSLNERTYISTENMLPNRGGISLSSSIPQIQKTTSFYSGDILISNIRPYFKKIYHADFDGGCSNDILVIRAKKNTDPSFLYYVLSDDAFFNYATATSKGTKMPRGDKEAIMNYLVPNPPLPVQRRIAEVLKAIDDKIEVNREINKNLEDMAKALYKQMFTDNVVCETSLMTLADIADIKMGQSPKGTTYNEDGNGEVFYQGRAEFGFRFPKRRLYTTDPKRMAEANDILLSVRAPVGDVNVATERCCIGRGLSAIHSKDGKNSFLFYTILSLKPQMDVFNGQGTVFGSINHNSLKALPIEMPSANAIASFEAIASPIDDMIRVNSDEVNKLQTLRDTLLPRLMSGEIDVSDIDITRSPER